MRIEKALADGVRILLCVRVTVVRAVALCPPSDGTLHGAAAGRREPDAKGEGGRVGAVSPEAVVSYSP